MTRGDFGCFVEVDFERATGGVVVDGGTEMVKSGSS